ncbi:MAG TPA: serine hydrolase domain-containing protein [Phenylobacterium sp.]|jgi:CubicO group peptidase (beta-lactamase class C family)|uniref:serine hydrolase domain-containing protein n=1 Tax=Phenylobacterium sp. TaxID=1871053 RepID=UPI002D249F06|nr:serine hydrolase domain-containing protein [Phenylobacterium sp.]HZZ69771.1 serine hydrolase domain-containing protein [Phenylobacterium sp.]
MSHSVKIDPAALTELFAPWNRSDEPGLVVGISHPAAGTWRAGYGLGSIELAMANTPRTRMRIGSTSKMFTCLGVLLLAEEGKLSIDDPIRKYIPELPEWAENMTPRHFMTHTSGMRCHIDVLYQTGNFARPAPAEAALEYLARQTGVNFPIGERWSYNNGGYNLMSLLIERITGQDFVRFQDERIFQPLGMIDTAVKRSDSEMLPNSASLHLLYPDGHYERGYFGISIAGEGAMVSTVEDMLVWLKHMHRPVVGSAESWRKIKTPARLNDGRTANYGLGLMHSDHRGVKVLHHAGGVFGGVSMCLTVPELELDVIIIANRSDAPVQPLGFQVIDACVEGLAALPDAKTGVAPTGIYWSQAVSGPLEVGEQDGQVFAKLWEAKLPMRHDGEGRIVSALPASDLSVTAVPGDADAVSVDFRGSTDIFRRVAPASDDAVAEAARLVGVYRFEDAEATATIRLDGERVSLRMAGPFGRDSYSLARWNPLVWTSRLGETDHGGLLEFTADAAGAITGFTVTTSRTRRLPFERVG